MMKRLISGKYIGTCEKISDETVEAEILAIVVVAASGKPDSVAPFLFYFFLIQAHFCVIFLSLLLPPFLKLQKL